MQIKALIPIEPYVQGGRTPRAALSASDPEWQEIQTGAGVVGIPVMRFAREAALVVARQIARSRKRRGGSAEAPRSGGGASGARSGGGAE
jgi:hypothetical protein